MYREDLQTDQTAAAGSELSVRTLDEQTFAYCKFDGPAWISASTTCVGAAARARADFGTLKAGAFAIVSSDAEIAVPDSNPPPPSSTAKRTATAVKAAPASSTR